MEFHEHVANLEQSDIPFVGIPLKQFMPTGLEQCETMADISEEIFMNHGYEPHANHWELSQFEGYFDVDEIVANMAEELDTDEDVINKFREEVLRDIRQSAGAAEEQNFVHDLQNKTAESIVESVYGAHIYSADTYDHVVHEVEVKDPKGNRNPISKDVGDWKYNADTLWVQFGLEPVQELLQDWINEDHIDADEIDEDLIGEVCDEIAADLEWSHVAMQDFWPRGYSGRFDGWREHFYQMAESFNEIKEYLDEQETFYVIALPWVQLDTQIEELADSVIKSLEFEEEGSGEVKISVTAPFQSTRRELYNQVQEQVDPVLQAIEGATGHYIECFTVKDRCGETVATDQDL